MKTPENENKKQKTTLSSILKNVFFIFLILQIAPLFFTNMKNFFQDQLTPKTDVGLLEIKGMLTNSDFYVEHIHEFLKAPHIRALLLKIDSSGGFPGTSQALFNELKAFKKEKPIIVLIENICASGAYYVASIADSIIATPSAIIGSIGVMLGMQGMPLPNLKELANDWKIKFTFIQSGAYKSAGNLFKEQSKEELSHLQSLADDTYTQFIKDVGQSRNLDIAKKELWADGKIFTGEQALQNKLIDHIGSLSDAQKIIKEKANIETDIRFIKPDKPTGIMSLFSSQQTDASGKAFLANGLPQNLFLQKTTQDFLEKLSSNIITLIT